MYEGMRMRSNLFYNSRSFFFWFGRILDSLCTESTTVISGIGTLNLPFFPIYAHCWYEHFGTDSITYSIFQSESSCCRTVLLYDSVMWQHRKFMGNRLRLLPIRTCVPFNRCDWLNLLLNRRRWVLHAVTKYL